MNDPQVLNENWVRNSILYSVRELTEKFNEEVEITEEFLNYLTKSVCEMTKDKVEDLVIAEADRAARLARIEAKLKK